MKAKYTKKDKKKFFRSIIQVIILMGIIWLIINTTFSIKKYKPFDDRQDISQNDKGFIALSYTAVDRDENTTSISKERLDEHFEALDKNGYLTIKQDDIEKYYKEDKALPEKSIFLMFEDGRVDTAIFAGDLLRKYNFIGTVLSYGDRLRQKDLKFLTSKDLKKLERSSFWELGTNGYRLSYINVYDRYNNFIGQLNYSEFSTLSKYFKSNYNHYLMDFIRDEDRIPKESYDEMKKRIDGDYELMDQVYMEEFGFLPKTYVIMHSNTGAFGTNEKASDINEEWINKLFAINFNREGYSHNNKESNIYDLTRIQAQSYWYPNHLLMRIQEDTKENMDFVYGDLSKKEDWESFEGVAEYRDSSIVLTSNPKGRGLVRLKESKEYKDYKISTTLKGNKLGSQSIYLRTDESLEEYIGVKIQNNVLYIEENGKIIHELDLEKHDGIIPLSVEEDEFIILDKIKDIYKKHLKSNKDSTKIESPKEIDDKEIRNIYEGAKEYVADISINEKGQRKLEIYLKDDKLSINIDGKQAGLDIRLSNNSPGYIYLESAWGQYGYSQRNIEDDVYDGVFEDLIINEIDKNEKILYKNKLEGFKKIKSKLLFGWNKTINWFIRNL